MTDNNENKKEINDHIDTHEYDGIKELNNPSPLWVILLFFATIAFSGFYAVKYFGFPNNGMDQTSEYLASVEEQKMKMNSDEGSGANQSDAEMIAEGEKIYAEKGCIACHGAKGEGNAIGPNLTDNFTLHGCRIDEIKKVIKEGVPEKGMTPFKSTLSEKQIGQLAVFISKKLVGSNPTNPKAAQGTECK